MAAALLLLGLLAPPALALRGAESPWAWNIAVIYKRNNPFSVAAKDAVKANLCARFAISPCEVTPNGKPGDIYLAADLDVHVPHKYFSDVIVWLQLQRSKTVNGGGYDLDVLAAPDLGEGDWPAGKAPSELAVYAGFPTSKNTNRFPAAGVAAARAAPAVAAPETHNTTCGNACDAADSGCAHTCDYLVHTMNLSCAENYAPGQKYEGWCDETCGYGGCEDDAWATSCSYDATCYAPYVNNTGCTGDAQVASMHFHFYYVPNANASLDKVNAFTDAATTELELDALTCPDNNGHEEPHNITCWLVGPGESGPMPAPPQWTQDHGTSSFDFSTFSLFVVREDLADVLQYVLSNKPADVDFLVHPNTGCSYADHVDWGLHATKYTVANRFGTADEGGWEDETTAPPNDGDSAGWAAANIPEPEECSAVPSANGTAGYAGFEIHFVYDPTPGTPGQSLAADIVETLKETFAAEVASGAVLVASPQLDAYADPTSPFLAAHTNVKLVGGPATLGAVLPWVLGVRASHADFAAHVDVVVAPRGPSSGRDPACGPGDYVGRSLYAGRRWQFNEAMNGAAEAVDAAPAVRALERPEAPATNAALYLLSAPNNAYQRAALANASVALEALFALESCGVDAPYLEPAGLENRLCALGSNDAPYHDEAEAFLVAYAAYHVPAGRLAEVLSAAMALKAAAGNGIYNVDLLLAPLTGDAKADYGAAALKGGSDWRMNAAALSA